MVQQPTAIRGHTTAGLSEPTPVDAPRQTMLTSCRYRDPNDALSQLGWKANADGDWVHANARWLEYTGLSREQSLKGGWLRAIHADDRDRVLDGWTWASAMEQRFECTCRLVRRDGRERQFLLRALPVVDELGRLAGWIGTATDVHDLRFREVGWVG